MKTLIHLLTLGLFVAFGGAPLRSEVPRNAAEAESFVRFLIETHFYDDLGLVGRSNLQKMRVERNEENTAVTFFLPRSTRTSPDFIITAFLNPVNAPLSRGHQHRHLPLRQHTYRDYENESLYATQSESYDRPIPFLGEESACVTVSAEKRRADDHGVVTFLDFAWLPEGQETFGLLIRLRNLHQNMPTTGNLGSDAFHVMTDKQISKLCLGVAHAARDRGFIRAAAVHATENFDRAVSALPHYSPNSPSYLEPALPPRAMTLAALRTPPQSPTTASTSTDIIPPPPFRPSTRPAERPEPDTLKLAPAEVIQLAITQGLVAAVPSPTPAIVAVRPTSPPSTPNPMALLGVRGKSTPAATRPAGFDETVLVGLLFDPDVRLIVNKQTMGFGVTVYAHAKDDWAAVVMETEEGYHLPVVTAKHDFPGPFADFLKLAAARPTDRQLKFELPPLRTALLRTMFELQESTRLLAGSDAAALTAYPAEEIMQLFGSPRLLSRLDALPESAQWEIQTVVGNTLLLNIELTLLQQQRLVRRLMIKGLPRYQLSPTGSRAARLIFAPEESLTVTRVPAQLTDKSPSVHLVNSAHFVADQTALLTYLPDGRIRFHHTYWRGGPSVWDLFSNLTEPET